MSKDGIPAQEVTDSPHYELALDDLTTVPEQHRKAEALRLIDLCILTPIDSSSGPLFAAKLIKLHRDEHMLLLAMDHMISDAFSLTILVKEVFMAYRLAIRGEPISLPPLAIQYSDYAAWQHRVQESWIQKDAAYWAEKLMGHQQLRFPVDRAIDTSSDSGLKRLAVKIAPNMTNALREWARSRRTTLTLAVLTAYAGLVLRWCDSPQTIIQYNTSGRESQEKQGTIGYFASILCLRIELGKKDRFADLASRIMQEYCATAQRGDLSYMALQAARLEFSRNTLFNWIPKEARSDLPLASETEGDSLRSHAVPLGNPALSYFNWDGDPELALWEGAHEITGHLYFTTDRFPIETMEHFLSSFTAFIGTMLTEPDARVADLRPV